MEQPLEQGGDPQPGQHAGGGGEDADRQRLQHHGPDDLAAGGADGAQQRDLPGPLAHDDRERVVDAERGHQQGDAGERGERAAQHGQEVGVDLVDPVLGQLGAGQGLDAPGEPGGDAVDQRLLRHARVCLDQDAADQVRVAAEVALGGMAGEPGPRDLTQAVLVAEGGDAHHPHPQRGRDLDGGHVTDGQVARLGGTPVDDDLVVGPGRPALGQPVGVEVGVGDPVAAQAWGPAATNGLTVTADDGGVALDRRLGGGDAVDASDHVEQAGVDHPRLLVVVAGPGDGLGVADDGVGAGGGLGEQVVEVGLHGVAQHQGAGEEGDAQEHGQPGADQPAFVAPGALDAQSQHVSLRWSGRPPSPGPPSVRAS
jgi:hypothetical protein